MRKLSSHFAAWLSLWSAVLSVDAPRTQSGAADTHWAYATLSRPEPPALRDAGWLRNPIDAFVAERLEEHGIAPSVEADRRSLIRRLSFDLTGLPPTPPEISQFLADRSDRAYEALVDRLLASPHYGERWARHWLDVARYGESDGFEYDEPRDLAWRYRAWVVDALNSDTPYDEFAREQIAGDVLHPGDAAAAIPTGFLVAGPYDRAGQVQLSTARRAIVRQDEIHEMVGTTMQAFLGMTVHCARCHDHKSEPIGQLDYYRVAAAFAGVHRGKRDVTPATGEHRALVQRRDTLRQQLDELEASIRARLRSERGGPVPAVSWDFATGSTDLALYGGAHLENGALVLVGGQSYASSPPLPFALGAKTIEVWVQLESTTQPGGAVLSIEQIDGIGFDALVYLGTALGQWWPGSSDARRIESFEGPRETEGASRLVHVAIVYAADGTITAFRDGVPYGRPFATLRPMAFERSTARVLIGRPRSDDGATPSPRMSVRRVAVHDDALPLADLAQSARAPVDAISEADVLAELTPEQRELRAAWRTELATVSGELEARAEIGYCVVSTEPEETHVLRRGQPDEKGVAVAAGGVAAIATLSPDFGLPLDAPDGVRRQRLAAWITDARNGLFARVAANRVWHHYFGRGLVETPSDFGRSGAPPADRELLDWLASELVESGYRLKHLHRLIVTSATYRQSTRTGDSTGEGDDTRWMTRSRPRRLEAEEIRDALLAISGALDPTVGGPGYRDVTIRTRGELCFYEPREPEADGPVQRSLYRMWVRGGRNALLEAFDCPDPSVATPARGSSTTPQQALALLNSGLVLRMADRFAERLQKEAPQSTEDQIRLAYELALGRPPTADEVLGLAPLVRRHGLAVFARAIFNCDEFIHVR